MKKPYYVFIGGILGDPESANEFSDKAEAYVEMNVKGAHATTLPYRSDVVFRRMGQEERVNNLDLILSRLDGRKIILVSFSNGGDIVERMTKRNKFEIEEIHLVASASENDFRKNGYNKALSEDMINKMFVYYSKKDKALQKAKWSSYLLSWVGLGYGFLGLTGPRNLLGRFKHRVAALEYDLDHNEYFNSDNFPKLMKQITGK